MRLMLKSLAVINLLLGHMAGAFGVESGSFEALKLQYEVQVELLQKPMAELDESYKARLAELEKEAVGRGELENVLLARDEIKLLGEGRHVRADGFAELKRMQDIYDSRSGEIVAERDEKMGKLVGQYLAHLEVMKKSLTKEKKIDAAVLVGDEIKRMVALRDKLAAEKKQFEESEGVGENERGEPSELKWEAMGEAKLIESPRDSGLAGVESAKTRSVVYMARPLPTKFTLTGECRLEGAWAGFALGLDPRANDSLSVYSNNGSGTRLERVLGGARKVLSEEKLDWKHERWTKFELVRDAKEWSLEVGARKIEFGLPDEVNGRYLGLVSYSNSSIMVRKLKLERK
ncbi:MAG: hypothetical protein ACI8XO_001545 [Verrucomicrobiales bacterium]|jgi:hypothetical protein